LPPAERWGHRSEAGSVHSKHNDNIFSVADDKATGCLHRDHQHELWLRKSSIPMDGRDAENNQMANDFSAATRRARIILGFLSAAKANAISAGKRPRCPV